MVLVYVSGGIKKSVLSGPFLCITVKIKVITVKIKVITV
jgi:hypothetical protein